MAWRMSLTSKPERRRLLLSVSEEATVATSLADGLWLGALVDGAESDCEGLWSTSAAAMLPDDFPFSWIVSIFEFRASCIEDGG